MAKVIHDLKRNGWKFIEPSTVITDRLCYDLDNYRDRLALCGYGGSYKLDEKTGEYRLYNAYGDPL